MGGREERKGRREGREGRDGWRSLPSKHLSWCLFQKRVLFLTNDYFFTDISDTPFR